jgi:hypothetical protein
MRNSGFANADERIIITDVMIHAGQGYKEDSAQEGMTPSREEM